MYLSLIVLRICFAFFILFWGIDELIIVNSEGEVLRNASL